MIASSQFSHLPPEAAIPLLKRQQPALSLPTRFVSGISCATNMLYILANLTQAFEDGMVSQAIFIDCGKAFGWAYVFHYCIY